MWNEGGIRAVAQAQFGLLLRSQALELGCTDAELRWRLRIGRVDQPHPGVYQLDSVAPTWRSEVLAGVFGAGPDAAASHRTAGVLYDLDGVYGRVIEVTVPYNEEPDPAGVLVHRTRRSIPASVIEGIRVTSVERTLLDLGPLIGPRHLYKAARSAIHKNLTTAKRLNESVRQYGGRGVAGTRLARHTYLLVSDDGSNSVAEIDLAEILRDANIPQPVQQLRIRLWPTENAYPDFSWPDRMRIVEADGFGTHSTPQDFEADLRRQNRLMELGWEIRRFSAKEIREAPNRVRDEIVHFVNKPFRAD